MLTVFLTSVNRDRKVLNKVLTKSLGPFTVFVDIKLLSLGEALNQNTIMFLVKFLKTG